MILLPCTKSPELLTLEALLPRLSTHYPNYTKVKDYYERLLSGYIGEASLDYYLRLVDLRNAVVLHGLRIVLDKESFQIDTLLLFPHFFLIIEAKNLKGEVILDPVSLQMIRDGEVFEHPILQAQAQKQHLTDILMACGIFLPPIHTLAAFTHKKVLLKKSEGDPDILVSQALPQRISELQSLYRKPYYKKNELLQIGRMLQKQHNDPPFS